MTDLEAMWTERVRAWRASGQTAVAFVEGKSFSASALRSWASRLGRRAAPAVAAPSTRLVRVLDTSAAAEPALVVAVGPARVLVRDGFDPALLRRIVAALGGTA